MKKESYKHNDIIDKMINDVHTIKNLQVTYEEYSFIFKTLIVKLNLYDTSFSVDSLILDASEEKRKLLRQSVKDLYDQNIARDKRKKESKIRKLWEI